MDRNYGGVIWTNHALKRLKERNIQQGDAWAVWKNPQKSEYDSKKGVWIYKRSYKDGDLEVAAKKNNDSEWLILSVWSGKAYKDQQRKSSPLVKLLLKIFRLPRSG